MNAKLDTDTAAFLETLLWIAEGNEDDTDSVHATGDPTIYKFSPEFVTGVDAFISGFREYLELTQNFNIDRLESISRSFGGNVFFSLSGHGCGFFDEYPPDDRDLGKELQAYLESYSGNKYRFESLDSDLAWTPEGKIDLGYSKEHLPVYRNRLFTAPWMGNPAPL